MGWEDPLEKEMATQASIIAWEIPWTEEPGGLQSMRSARVGHNLATKQQQKIIHMSLFTKQKETHRHKKQIYGNRRRKEEGGIN